MKPCRCEMYVLTTNLDERPFIRLVDRYSMALSTLNIDQTKVRDDVNLAGAESDTAGELTSLASCRRNQEGLRPGEVPVGRSDLGTTPNMVLL